MMSESDVADLISDYVAMCEKFGPLNFEDFIDMWRDADEIAKKAMPEEQVSMAAEDREKCHACGAELRLSHAGADFENWLKLPLGARATGFEQLVFLPSSSPLSRPANAHARCPCRGAQKTILDSPPGPAAALDSRPHFAHSCVRPSWLLRAMCSF